MPVTVRSTKSPTTKADVIRLRTLGKTISFISQSLGISEGTVRTILKESEYESRAKTPIEKVFSDAGITPASIAAKLSELQNAKEVKRVSWEGKFTDERADPDNTVQFRATEATAKILGLFPKEDTAAVAQLFVRLPDAVLTKGHPQTCTCAECCSAWEAITVSPTESTTK